MYIILHVSSTYSRNVLKYEPFIVQKSYHSFDRSRFFVLMKTKEPLKCKKKKCLSGKTTFSFSTIYTIFKNGNNYITNVCKKNCDLCIEKISFFRIGLFFCCSSLIHLNLKHTSFDKTVYLWLILKQIRIHQKIKIKSTN